MPRPDCAILDREMRPVPSLINLYRGASAFLLCGGPSLRYVDPCPLIERQGFVVMAVNNSPAILEPKYLRPDLWTCVDTPSHFLEHLWRDPGIMKFVASHKLGITLRSKRNGRFVPAKGFTPGQAPNVWCYRRQAYFDPATFLTDPLLTWGTAKGIDGPLGDGSDQDCRSVLLVAIRLLYALGVRSIYLLGADFHMGRGSGNQYGFGQSKDDERACASNNRKFGVLDRWFRLLRPILEASGMHIYNCTVGSHLGAFDAIGYAEAIGRAQGECGRPVDAEGWY